MHFILIICNIRSVSHIITGWVILLWCLESMRPTGLVLIPRILTRYFRVFLARLQFNQSVLYMVIMSFIWFLYGWILICTPCDVPKNTWRSYNYFMIYLTSYRFRCICFINDGCCCFIWEYWKYDHVFQQWCVDPSSRASIYTEFTITVLGEFISVGHVRFWVKW